MKNPNTLPGLFTANELVSRDLRYHRDFAVLLYSMVNKKLEEASVKAIVTGWGVVLYLTFL